MDILNKKNLHIRKFWFILPIWEIVNKLSIITKEETE